MSILRQTLNLINTLQKALLNGEYPHSKTLISLCIQALGNEIPFGIYTETSKGFLNVFKSEKKTKVLKDVVSENEISKKIRKLGDETFFDIAIFFRKFQRKILIRVSLPPLLQPDEENLSEVINSFYSFQELYDRNYVLLELIKILKATAEVDDIEEVIENATKVTKKLLGTQGASILLKDEKKDELFFKVVESEKSDKIKEVRIPTSKGIAGYTARTGKSLIVNDVSSHPEFYSKVDEKSGFTTKSLISAAIKPLNRTIGVIEAVNKLRETNFTEEDLELLETIADILGISLINSILHQKINKISTDIIKALITALEARDEYTKGHSYRVQIFSVKIARALGLPSKKIKKVELSSILHDIGKIGIPDNILRKPGKLSEEEYETIKKHPIIGYNILSSVEGLEDILDGIKYHHEKFDGTGYPEGLKGKDIPLIARIIAVADTLDAMTSDRPYRKALPLEIALEEIKKVKGTQLDPEIVETFLNSFSKTEETLQDNM
ncbi:MAG: HD domain-containing phosphohydrolase [Brevinematia bacterium]